MKAPILLLLFPLLACAAGPSPDHSEFEAMLFAPYRAPPSGARTFPLSFDYPHSSVPVLASWRLDLARAGVPVAQWHGQVLLRGAPGASAESLEDMMDIALTECERFFPAFQFVLWGGKAPGEALQAAMLDCVGEA